MLHGIEICINSDGDVSIFYEVMLQNKAECMAAKVSYQSSMK